jgi:ATP-dependent DNA helicase RecQ
MERINHRVEEKQHNLNRKRLILEKIIALVESEENEQTLDGLKECMRQWREIGPITKEFHDEIYKSYKFYTEKYYNQLSMFYELKELDKDKNLEVKIDLIKRAEQLNDEPNIRKALLQLNKYHEDWKNTGPVRSEISDDIWMRFKAASDIVIEIKKAEKAKLEIDRHHSLAEKIDTKFIELSGPKILGKIEFNSDIGELNNFIHNPNPKSFEKPREKQPTSRNSSSFSNNENILQNNKLGVVKFFDPIKGFGYVHSYSDKKDCFIHISKLSTKEIVDGDIVVFKTIPSRKKPGELDAIAVSNKIFVFVFNKNSSTKSFAYPILDGKIENEIALNENYFTGFSVIAANLFVSSWRTSLLPIEIIPKADFILFGRRILLILLSNPIGCEDTIEWVTSFLQTELTEAEISQIYNEVIISLEQKSILKLGKEIHALRDVLFFKKQLELKEKTLNKISFVLWVTGAIEKLPSPSNQEEFDIWKFEVLPSLDWTALQQILKDLLSQQGPTKLVEESYRYLISQGWEINSKEELQVVTRFLETFKTVFPSIALEESNYRCDDNQIYIDLYNLGLIKELSEAIAKQYIEELKTDQEKAGFIEKLPSDKILSYYFSFPSLSNYQENYIAGILESEFSKIDFLCFDLESDGEKINEFAWKSRLGVKCESDFKKPEDGIAELVTLINSGSLIIGQNIKEFDLSVLSNHGASQSSDFIWDTLDVEMLLNPERFSYGLKTQHSAASDTELTYRLFKNQLSRIIVSQSNLDAVKELLPSKAIEAINQISSNSNWALLDYEYFVKQSNEFFRPNPTNQNISEQTFNQLTEKLNEVGNKVIIAPEFLWNTLSHQFDLTFYSDNKSLGFCLNK